MIHLKAKLPGGESCTLMVHDLDALFHAGGEDQVVVYIGETGAEGPDFVQKKELRDLSVGYVD